MHALPLVPVEAGAGGDEMTLNEEYRHAEWLENQGELYRSASWYLRVLHLAENHELRDRAALGVVRVHRRGEKWKEAILWGEKVRAMDLSPDIRTIATLEVSDSLIRLGRADDAVRELEALDTSTIRSEERCRAVLLLGFSHLSRKDVGSARRAWDVDARTSGCSRVDRFKNILEDADDIDKPSKLAAGLLALAPGAGYLVAGKRQTALATFLVNGLLIAGAVEAFDRDLNFLGTTFSIFALGWYTGSIYGSLSSVDRIYESRWEDVLSGVDLESY